MNLMLKHRRSIVVLKLYQMKNGSGSLYRKVILPIFFDRTPLNQNTTWPNAVWPNTIWPKGHLTETPFDRTPFDRKFIYRNKSFGHKQNLSRGRLTENIWKRVISPKIKFEKLVKWPKWHLTENSFDRKLSSKNGHSTVGHTYYSNGIWKAGQMTIFRKKYISGQTII
jgi:hypothetical protein